MSSTAEQPPAAPLDPAAEASSIEPANGTSDAARDHPAAVGLSGDTPVVNVLTEPPTEPVRDVDQINPADYLPLHFPVTLTRTQGFQAVVRRSVLNEVHRHGQSSLDVEVCGVLVGNVFRDEAGAFLIIDGSIRGTHAASRNAQVTFTAETWTSIQAELEANHPNRKIVGWYHTHPGFGIFLSDMDLFIHGNFFNFAWQVAMVYDPKSGEEGLFIWKAGKTERTAMLVEEDVEHEVASPASMVVTPEIVGELAYQLTRFQKRLKNMRIMLAVAVVIAIAWPFVLYTAMSGRSAPLQVLPARTATNNASTPSNPAATSVGPANTVASVNPAEGVKPLTGSIDPGTVAIPTTQVVPATLPATNITPPPSTQPVKPIDPASTETVPPPVSVPTKADPAPPEIIRGGNSPLHGPKVIETPPETPGPGSPK